MFGWIVHESGLWHRVFGQLSGGILGVDLTIGFAVSGFRLSNGRGRIAAGVALAVDLGCFLSLAFVSADELSVPSLNAPHSQAGRGALSRRLRCAASSGLELFIAATRWSNDGPAAVHLVTKAATLKALASGGRGIDPGRLSGVASAELWQGGFGGGDVFVDGAHVGDGGGEGGAEGAGFLGLGVAFFAEFAGEDAGEEAGGHELLGEVVVDELGDATALGGDGVFGFRGGDSGVRYLRHG